MSDGDLLHGEPLAGRYEVVTSISLGNHFDVYRAYHTRVGWPVALKILKADLAEDEELADQVQSQLEIVSRLVHPNLVRTYEVGRTPAGQPFAAMAYVQGTSLALWPRGLGERGRSTSTRDLLLLARQIALGIAALHDAGIIHHELNPHNVLVRQDSTPVIIGIGLPAGISDQIAQETDADIVQYSAPEVRSGVAPDPRSNIYSLGVILFELLSLNSHREQRWPLDEDQPAPFQSIGEDYTAETALVVNMCLRQDPDQRYQSMEALIEGLDKALAADSGGVFNRITSRWAESNFGPLLASDRRYMLIALPLLLLVIFAAILLLTGPANSALEAVLGEPAVPVATGAAASARATLAQRAKSSLLELLEPVQGAAYEPGTEIRFRWCWSEQPLEQEQFAIYVRISDEERRLEQQIDKVDALCYEVVTDRDEFKDQYGELDWRIILTNQETGEVVVVSDWRTFVLLTPTPVVTATQTRTPSPSPTNTSTATRTPSPTQTRITTPTMTPTASRLPATSTPALPPPAATETPLPPTPVPPTPVPPTPVPPTPVPPTPAPPTPAPPTATPRPPNPTSTPP